MTVHRSATQKCEKLFKSMQPYRSEFVHLLGMPKLKSTRLAPSVSTPTLSQRTRFVTQSRRFKLMQLHFWRTTNSTSTRYFKSQSIMPASATLTKFTKSVFTRWVATTPKCAISRPYLRKTSSSLKTSWTKSRSGSTITNQRKERILKSLVWLHENCSTSGSKLSTKTQACFIIGSAQPQPHLSKRPNASIRKISLEVLQRRLRIRMLRWLQT